MKRFAGLSSLIIIMAFAVFTYLPVGDQIATAILARNPLLHQCQALVATAYHLEPSMIDFTVSTADLNTDGQDDYLVQLHHKSTCGTTGCIYEICRVQAGGEVKHLSFGYSGTTLTPLDTYTQGVLDLSLNNTAVLHWTGDRYDLGH